MKLGGRLVGGPLLGDCLGIGRLVVSNFFHLHHLSVLGFISVIFLFITIYNYYLYYYISIIKLFLSQPVSFLAFTLPILFPPILLGGGLCGA